MSHILDWLLIDMIQVAITELSQEFLCWGSIRSALLAWYFWCLSGWNASLDFPWWIWVLPGGPLHTIWSQIDGTAMTCCVQTLVLQLLRQRNRSIPQLSITREFSTAYNLMEHMMDGCLLVKIFAMHATYFCGIFVIRIRRWAKPLKEKTCMLLIEFWLCHWSDPGANGYNNQPF